MKHQRHILQTSANWNPLRYASCLAVHLHVCPFIICTPYTYNFFIEKEIELPKIEELLYSVFLKYYQNVVNNFT